MLKTIWKGSAPCVNGLRVLWREREYEEQATPVLVMRRRNHKKTSAMLRPRRGTEFPLIAKSAANFIDQLGHNSHGQVRQRAGDLGNGEGNRTSSPRGKPDRPGETTGGRKLVHWGCRTCSKTRVRSGQNTEGCTGGASHWDPPDARVLCWLVEFASYLMNRCDIDSDGKTPLHRLHGRKGNTPILEFGEMILVHASQSSKRRNVENRDPIPECLLACRTRCRKQWLSPSKDRRSKHGQRTSGESLSPRDATRTEHSEMRAVPWSPDGSDGAFDIQVGMDRPAMVSRDPGEVLMEKRSSEDQPSQSRLRWSLSEGCPGCQYLRSCQRQQAHSACRRRMESLLKGDSSGSARLAAADERISRAPADAVERHATKDPGVRGILERTSVVCHPESEPQKRISLDTEQDSTPHPSVSYGGSSASGAQLSVITSTDQNTGTSDVTREVRT